MSRTRIKICGLTREEEVSWACQLGADAIGLVFYAGSPRAVDTAAASALIAAVPPFVTVTGLFMNATEAGVAAVLRCIKLDLLQFHGQESAAFCARFGLPYITAIPMGGHIDAPGATDYAASHPHARGFLLDGNASGQAGGSGKVFDWQKVPAIPGPVILAGGLNAANVAAAVRKVQPFGVDVSSGVEEKPGKKDYSLLSQFFQEVRLVDQQSG